MRFHHSLGVRVAVFVISRCCKSKQFSDCVCAACARVSMYAFGSIFSSISLHLKCTIHFAFAAHARARAPQVDGEFSKCDGLTESAA